MTVDVKARIYLIQIMVAEELDMYQAIGKERELSDCILSSGVTTEFLNKNKLQDLQ
jgi:hypothetical protein